MNAKPAVPMRISSSSRQQAIINTVRISGGKTLTCTFRARPMISSILAVLISSFMGQTYAAPVMPTGGQTVAGSATISQPNSNYMRIDQTSNNAALNWNSFSIGSGGHVQFVQPTASAVALNRVVGNDSSAIYGQLSANGQVFLVNNAGILFAPGSQVDVGGLVASTLGISDADFMAGRYVFTNGGSAGTVVNQGSISAGYAALLAPRVANEGLIVARMGGTVALAAGDSVNLDLVGDGLISVNVSQAAINANASNNGLIEADGGQVYLTARSANALLDTVINMNGVVKANSLVNRNGVITLDGGNAGVVSVTGTLDASGTGTGQTGGKVEVLGDKVGLFAGAVVDVSGDAGGGTALIGGNFHGTGIQQNASQTIVSQGASINADAISTGNGGNVAVWSDVYTRFAGNISARGGAVSGNGGFVETSGKQSLGFHGMVNTSAAHGKTGTLLLDPANINVVLAGADASTLVTASAFATPGPTAGDSNLDVALINAALANVVLQAANNITFNTSVNIAGAGVGLTAQAGNNIAWGANTITTNGGAISFTANDAASLTATGLGAITGTGAVTGGSISLMTTGGGAISVGALNAGAAGLVNLTSGGPIVGTGTITAGTLTTSAAGGTTLNGANAVANFGATDTGAVALINTAATLGLNAITSAGLQVNNTGSIITSGLISSSGNIDLFAIGGVAADVTISGGINYTNALVAGALNIQANRNIIVQTAPVQSTGAQALNVIINSDRNADNSGAVAVLAGGNILSNGGNITIGGGAGVISAGIGFAHGNNAAAGLFSGISVFGNLTASGGNIIMNGIADAVTNGLTRPAGVNVSKGGAVSTMGAGSVTLTGLSMNSGPATFETWGVQIGSGTTTGSVTNQNGSILISGTSGQATNSIGTLVYNGNVQATGTGSITINGTTGNNVAAQNMTRGIDVELNSVVHTNSGILTLNGVNTSAPGSVGVLYGVHINGNSQVGSQIGAINLIGSGGAGSQGVAVNYWYPTVSGSVTSVSGNILLRSLSGIGMDLNGATLSTTGNLTLDAIGGGAINQIGGSITAAGLRVLGDTNATASLTSATNHVGTLVGNLLGATSSMSYTDNGAFTIGSLTTDDTGTGVLTTTTGLTLGTATANTLTLRAGGVIGEAVGSGITAGTLTTSAVGGTTLGGANLVANFGATDTGAVSLTNTAATLGLNAITAAGLTVNNTGGIQVNGLVTDTGATNLTASTNMNVATGGITSAGAVNLNFGGGGAGGTLTLVDTAPVNGLTVTATGGAGTDTIVVTSNAAATTLGAATLTGIGAGTIGLSGVEAANLTGGTGANAINASTFVGNVTIYDTAGGDTITGNGAATTMVGQNVANTWNIAGVNSGNIGALTSFSGVGNLTGGSADDTFMVGALGSLTGNIAGGGQTLQDTVNGSAVGGVITINQQTGVVTKIGGFVSGIEAVVGNGVNTTIIGADAGQAFNITGADTGTAGTLAFTGVGNLSGGTGNDTFTFANAGTLSGNLDGGLNGANSLNLSAKAGAVTVSQQTTNFTGIAGTYANINSVAGNGATTIVGVNTGQNFNITGSDTGTAGTLVFTGVGSLTGGTGNDTFTFANAGTLSGNLDGGLNGANSLNLSAKAGAVTISQQTANFTGIAGTYANINSVAGNGATTIVGVNTGQNFNITGSDAGTAGTLVFTGVGNLSGGTGADTFTFTNAGTLSGNLDGGVTGANSLDLSAKAGAVTVNQQATNFTGIAGTYANINSVAGNGASTTIVGANAGQTFSVTGANSGTAGALNFAGAGNLTGGTGNDTFILGVTGTLSGSLAGGGQAADTLNLSAKTGAVSINQQAATASGISGTFSGIGAIVGNDAGVTANTTITGINAGQTFTITGTNAGMAGTLAFTGAGNLTGGAGADMFAGTAGSSLSGAINDGGGATSLAGTITTTGAQTYTGAITAGTVTLAAGGSAITATNAANDFGGAVTATGSNVALADGTGGIVLSNVTATGSLDVTSTNGAITQTAAVNVTGAATLKADNGAVGAGNVRYGITLNNAANDFAGNVTATGSNVVLTDGTGGIILNNVTATGSLDVTSTNGAITQTAMVNVTGATTLKADNGAVGAGNVRYGITLNNAANDFCCDLAATGAAVTVTDVNDLWVGNITGSTLALSAVNLLRNGTDTINATTAILTANGGSIGGNGATPNDVNRALTFGPTTTNIPATTTGTTSTANLGGTGTVPLIVSNLPLQRYNTYWNGSRLVQQPEVARALEAAQAKAVVPATDTIFSSYGSASIKPQIVMGWVGNVGMSSPGVDDIRELGIRMPAGYDEVGRSH